jgi:hypothetical protein
LGEGQRCRRQPEVVENLFSDVVAVNRCNNFHAPIAFWALQNVEVEDFFSEAQPSRCGTLVRNELSVHRRQLSNRTKLFRQNLRAEVDPNFRSTR